jgi:ATP-dependent Zn protease
MHARDLPTEEIRRHTAYHEAGHAVVAQSQGIDISKVTIGDRKDGYVDYTDDLEDRIDKRDFDTCYRFSLVQFAGLIAAAREFPKVIDIDGNAIDMTYYFSKLRPVLLEHTPEDEGVWDQRIPDECKPIVDERWIAVEALAQKLLERTTMTGDEAVAIIDAALSK